MLLTQAIAIPRGRRGVISGTVALDGKNHSARLRAVLGHEVDIVAGYPVLRNQGNPGLVQSFPDV